MGDLLKVQKLGVSYRAAGGRRVTALEGVSFEIQEGRALGLLGESGSGKTSTALAILRLLPPSAVLTGSIEFGGRDLAVLPERELEKIRGAEISLIFQEPALSLHPTRRVGAQVAEVIRAHRQLPRKRCREEAERTLAEVGFSGIDRIYAAYPHELSGGQRQRVAIAQALACRPRLLIADEPTAALDSASEREILALIADLKHRHGLALLLISHKPAVLEALADDVLEVGRPLPDGPGSVQKPAQNRDREGAVFAVQVRNLTKDYVQRRFTVRALDEVSLDVPAGSILVITGESGAGKSTLARSIAGFERPTSGEIRVEGEPQLVLQDPGASLNPRFTAAEIVSEPLDIRKRGTRAERRRAALALMEQVGLPASAADRKAGQFSGGQRQRLAIARALAVEPKVLILDESFSALDRRLRIEMLNLLLELQRSRPLTLILIVHDPGFAAPAAHEIVTMRAGRIVARERTQVLAAV